jgi:hypothetical protein
VPEYCRFSPCKYNINIDIIVKSETLHKNIEQGVAIKVSCSLCGTPIADEGRRMWLAFPSLFDFGFPPAVPKAFRPTCHIFYGSRVIDIYDDLPKWSGHKNHSERLV